MKKKIKKIAILVSVGFIVGLGTVVYLFNMPHRNVQNTRADYTLNVSTLVNEYLSDPAEANAKYLSSDGDSKILEVSGTVLSIRTDLKGQTVVLLKSANELAGVSATLSETDTKIGNKIEIGSHLTMKGVIQRGASYDSDMEIYTDVVLAECSVLKYQNL